jgi:hypothetical protein
MPEKKLFVAEIDITAYASIVAENEREAHIIALTEEDEILGDTSSQIWIKEVKGIEDIPADLMDWETRGDEVVLCRTFFERMMEEKRKREAEAIRDKQQMKLDLEDGES